MLRAFHSSHATARLSPATCSTVRPPPSSIRPRGLTLAQRLALVNVRVCLDKTVATRSSITVRRAFEHVPWLAQETTALHSADVLYAAVMSGGGGGGLGG